MLENSRQKDRKNDRAIAKFAIKITLRSLFQIKIADHLAIAIKRSAIGHALV